MTRMNTLLWNPQLPFWLHQSNKEDVTRKMHLAFSADSRNRLMSFTRRACSRRRSNGAPGLREHGPNYYAAYVLDFEENNIEVVTINKLMLAPAATVGVASAFRLFFNRACEWLLIGDQFETANAHCWPALA